MERLYTILILIPTPISCFSLPDIFLKEQVHSSFVCVLGPLGCNNKIPQMYWRINNRNLFLTVRGPGRSKIKESTWLGEGLLPGLEPDSFPCILTGTLLWGPNPTHRTKHLLICHLWRLRFQPVNRRREAHTLRHSTQWVGKTKGILYVIFFLTWNKVWSK